MSHTHDEPHGHSHDAAAIAAEHGHSHEILTGPGSFLAREPPIVDGRDFTERAFTIGIGGYEHSHRSMSTNSITDSNAGPLDPVKPP